MLSTSNLSAAQAENYFVKDDYYTEAEQHEASFWAGKGAAYLGLTGTVEKSVFSELLGGTGPNGHSLSGQKIDSKKRRAATDFTFSAPKSVSIAALVQRDERVLAAHHQAVAKVLSVLEERYAQTRISTDTGRQRLTTGNLTVAVFPHATNREAEPQLHSHCVVMNATQLPDGRWFSLANEQAIANKKLLGQIYQNELAIALKNHGYIIESKAHGQFEIAGYSPELLKLFSTRRQQIESLVALWEAEGKGVFSEDGKVLRSRLALYEAAALKSRKRKPKPMEPEQLRQGWNALVQLERLELPKLPEPLSDPGQDTDSQGGLTVESIVSEKSGAAITIAKAVQHCGEREAVFRRTRLERFAFEHQLGQQSFDQLQTAIENSPKLVRIDDTRMTTQTAIQLELEMIRLMQAGTGQVSSLALPNEVEPLLEKRSLTAEQQNAIVMAMTVTDTAIAWQGSAGVGKTYALNELKVLMESNDIQVKGFAPSAEAAHTLGESLKIEAGTVAGLLVSQVTEFSEPALWIVDEAGLLSMKDAHALLLRAQSENARVLLVGDTKQLSAVEAGNPFRSLQAGGIALATLDHSLRQKTEELKLSVHLVSEGKIGRGIDVLDQAGCLCFEPDVNKQIDQMVSDYLQLSPGTRAKTLLLAGTNQERRILTQHLRKALQTKGNLGQDELSLMSLRRKDVTSVQAQYLSAYALGDVMIPTQDYKNQGLVKSQQYVVRGIEPEAHQLVVETVEGRLMRVDPARCDRKTVYSVQSMTIAMGDRLRWTKNDRAAKTRNGQRFTVAEISTNGKVMAMDESGQSRWFDLSGRQHVDYAWVSTTYSSQGKTADRVLALMGEKTTNRESFYVAVSRAKHGLTLYATDKHELIRKAQASKSKENASDYIPLFIKVKENAVKAEVDASNAGEKNVSSHDRGLGQPISVGDRESVPHGFSTNTPSPRTTQSTSRTKNVAFEEGMESMSRVLSEQAESLSHAISEHIEQSELLECESVIIDAVESINSSLEQLAQAAGNRNQFATAVNRLNTTVGNEIDRRTAKVLSETGAAAQRLADQRDGDTKPDYKALWQYYSKGIKTRSDSELDYKVGLRAFKAGMEQKAIALMLVSESKLVQQLYQSYGKHQSMTYVNQLTRRICQQQTANSRRALPKRHIEMD